MPKDALRAPLSREESPAFPGSAPISSARCRPADQITEQFETVQETSHETTELVFFLRHGGSIGQIRAGDLLVPTGPVTHCQPRAVRTRTAVVARDPSRSHREEAGSTGQTRVVAWGCRIVHRDSREALSFDVPVDSSNDYFGCRPFDSVIIPGRSFFLLCASGEVTLGYGGTH
jgi:hypothetical protein